MKQSHANLVDDGLQRWSKAQLQKDMGFTRERAQQLAQWAWGQCSAPVAQRAPAKTLSVQMSLTPTPLAMHPSFQGKSVCDDDSVTGGPAADGTLPANERHCHRR